MTLKKPFKRAIVFIGLIVSLQSHAQQFEVLIITETAGWHHESIDAGIKAINGLAATHNFTAVRQQKAMPITLDRLNQFEAVVFLSTTKDIFNDEEQAAFEKYIQSGKGYVGIHSASDTEYDWEWYTKLVGHLFVIHPIIQTAQINIIDKNFPGLESSSDKILITDEWYEFTDAKIEGLNYLISVDEKAYDPNADWGYKDGIGHVKGSGMGEFHPISWYHEFDGGRSFYTALGHIDKIYENSWFLNHLYGGIFYAATGKGIYR